MTCQEPSAKDISIMKSSIHEMPTKKATHKIHKLQGLGHLILSVLVVCGTLMYRYLKMGPFMELSCSLAGRNCPVQVSSQGYVDSMYLAVKDAFEKNFLLGHDIGAGVAVYVDNELVIDLQAGWQDKENHTPFSEDTLQVVFSSTKVLTSIVVAQFVQKGLLSYDEKISTYWPEFAQGNKENVTLNDLMQHAAGVGFMDRILTSAEAQDLELFESILAKRPHTFDGVRKRSYHAATHGWYINAILRRVANCTVDDVAAELNQKYGIEWYLKPYQEEFDNRIAKIYRGSKFHRTISFLLEFVLNGPHSFSEIKAILDKDGVVQKTLRTSALDNAPIEHAAIMPYRQIEGPSYSGFTNARSMAKLAAMMANGGKAIQDDEPDLLDEKTYALATEPVEVEYDWATRRYVPSLRSGFAVVTEHVIDNVTFIGWTGLGGSILYWNPEHRIGFGYCPNGMARLPSPDHRSLSILEALVKRVKALEHK